MPNINPGLTPTVITDRNGKITTVHKKTDGMSRASAMPPPALSIRPRSLDRVLEAFHRRSANSTVELPSEDELATLHSLMAAGAKGGEITSYKQIFLSLIGSRGRDKVTALIDAYRKEGFKQLFNATHESYSAGQLVGIASLYEPEFFCNDSATNSGAKTEARTRGYVMLFHAIRECEHLEQVDPNNLTETSPDTFKQVKSYAHLFAACRDVDNSLRNVDGELVKYALSDGVSAEEVAGIIRENRTVDVVTIRGIIEGVPKAVAQGWL